MTKHEKTRLQNLRAKKKAGHLFDRIEMKMLARLEAVEAASMVRLRK
jgi:hypothetical protein